MILVNMNIYQMDWSCHESSTISLTLLIYSFLSFWKSWAASWLAGLLGLGSLRRDYIEVRIAAIS
jgi:hypothetical protein